MSLTMTNKRETVGEAVLLSASDCARLSGVSQRVSSAELNEQIVLLLWRLQGALNREEQQEAYQCLEVLLSRKYAGGAVKNTETKAISGVCVKHRGTVKRAKG